MEIALGRVRMEQIETGSKAISDWWTWWGQVLFWWIKPNCGGVEVTSYTRADIQNQSPDLLASWDAWSRELIRSKDGNS